MDESPIPQLTPALRDLIFLGSDISRAHGVHPNAALIQLIAFGSALAGPLISSRPDGHRIVTARFSLTLRTPDLCRPYWIANEFYQLHRRQDEIRQIGGTGLTLKSLRRRKKVTALLNDENGADVINRQMEIVKRREQYCFIHPVSAKKPPSANGNGMPMTLEVEGWAGFRKILNSRGQSHGYATLIEAGHSERANIVGWISKNDWKSLTKMAGSGYLPDLGWILSCPATTFSHEGTVPSRPAAVTLLQRLEAARFRSIQFAYHPSTGSKALLDWHAGETEKLLATLPDSQRDGALPDPYIAWHLSAILTALCCEGEGAELDSSIYQATCVGVLLASWLVRQHVYHFRHAYPADESGLFTGQDLRVLRFLGLEPVTVRSIQRRLRGVSAESCLASLRRAVSAGLAVENEFGRFGAFRPPPLDLTMSEFLSAFGPLDAFPPASETFGTDGTDTTAAGDDPSTD
jgi:hypothetical protein